jgi:hypothetical protein
LVYRNVKQELGESNGFDHETQISSLSKEEFCPSARHFLTPMASKLETRRNPERETEMVFARAEACPTERASKCKNSFPKFLKRFRGYM